MAHPTPPAEPPAPSDTAKPRNEDPPPRDDGTKPGGSYAGESEDAQPRSEDPPPRDDGTKTAGYSGVSQ